MVERLRCELVTWHQVDTLSRRLAKNIRAAGFEPDVIVAIGRGGYVPARLLSDLLEQDNLTSFKIEHYKAGAHKEPVARIRYPLSVELQDSKVLIVDDVSDSGDTFEVAVEHVQAKGPVDVKTAVLHHKTTSSYEPHFLAHKIIKWRWIIYPWAVIEDLTGFIRRLPERPKDLDRMAQTLRKEYGVRARREILDEVWERLRS
jgi:hypoxanthine phosphoribosyltransferase